MSGYSDGCLRGLSPYSHNAGSSCSHLYITYCFLPEPPGAIMVPSGTWAKVTAISLLQSVRYCSESLQPAPLYLDCLHKCCIARSSLQQGIFPGTMLITRGCSWYPGPG